MYFLLCFRAFPVIKRYSLDYNTFIPCEPFLFSRLQKMKFSFIHLQKYGICVSIIA